MEILNFKNKEDWLKQRTKDITSTEISALFDLSPYLTKYELYHNKKAESINSIAFNERMLWGDRLEHVIAETVAEQKGWKVEPFKSYVRDQKLKMGSSFDYKILDKTLGEGILEIKNVDSLVFRAKWAENSDGSIEAPPHIELQLQHQLTLTGLKYGYIVALVGGNTIKILRRDFDPDIANAIKAKIADFWLSVEQNNAPDPDYQQDSEFMIKQLYNKSIKGSIFEADEQIDKLVKSYQDAINRMKKAESEKKELTAQILEKVGTASKIRSVHGEINCGMSKGSAGTVVTSDMVGQTLNKRNGFRMFRLAATKTN